MNDWLRPQLFGKTYIVNPPRWLSMASRLAGGIMSKKSLEKVAIHKAKVNEGQECGAEESLLLLLAVALGCAPSPEISSRRIEVRCRSDRSRIERRCRRSWAVLRTRMTVGGS